MLEKIKLINYSISITDKELSFKPIKSGVIKDIPGFDLYIYEDDNYKIFLQGANIKKATVLELITVFENCFLKNVKHIYDFLSEIFQLYVWDKNKLTLHTLTDYLGVGTNYMYRNKKKVVFFSNFIQKEELGIQLEINPEDLYNYLAIGYQVSPFKLPYKNISTHKGCVLYTYKNTKVYSEPVTPCLAPSKKIETVLVESIVKNIENAFLGITAGKDSLALISLIEEMNNKLLGNFGHKKSADVLQGKKIADQLNLNYIYQDYANSSEFEKYSREIALISGGLATASYVDMLCFVSKSIPLDYTYIMGEGGECVRDFFKESAKLEDSLEKYITPKEYLEKTLLKNNYNNVFKTALIKQIEETYIEEPLLNFYRHERMPGNFSNRHKILSTYRAKYSPFLNYDFIRNGYNIKRENYKNNNLHKEIIKNKNKSLLKWFYSPLKTSYSAQNYEERFSEYLGEILLNIFNNMSQTSQKYFNKEGLIDLLNTQFNKVDRGIYYLLRVISFIIFIDSNELSFTSKNQDKKDKEELG